MSNAVYQICRLCGLPDDVAVKLEDHGERWIVRCPTCGNYSITRTVHQGLDQATKHKLSAWTRLKKESGQPAPLISSETLDTIVSSLPNYSVADKQRLLMQVLAESSLYPGDSVHLNYKSLWPRIWATGSNEAQYIANALEGRVLLKFTQKTGDYTMDCCQITPAGWDYIDNVTRERSKSNQAFVAMWFDLTMHQAWEQGIRPALVGAGYTPYRVDNDPSNLGRIDAKIEAEIKRSRFLVADVTGGRQGVYYEAGYAMGLGLPVIWSVRNDRVNDMHFDTRQYNHIIWSTPKDLADNLGPRVIAAIR